MFAISLYVPFLDNVNRLFIKRFCFTQVSSGQAVMITYIVAALFSAPLGYLVDKVGYKRYFIIVSMVIFTFAQFLILIYPQCPENGLE
jgi:MFS family permease